MLMCPAAFAADFVFSWDPVAVPVDGYRLYVRYDSADYANIASWEGADTTATVTLDNNRIIHAIVRAYRGAYESGDSNEVSGMVLDIPGNLNLMIKN